MQALQSPATIQEMEPLFAQYPQDRQRLLGTAPSNSTEGLSHLILKKMELAFRIDACGSQALAFAVTSIRTLCLLAARQGGSFLDALARSLKIGFLLTFQSLLSAQGDEMGMVEDLDSAAFWLNLVTVRLVEAHVSHHHSGSGISGMSHVDRRESEGIGLVEAVAGLRVETTGVEMARASAAESAALAALAVAEPVMASSPAAVAAAPVAMAGPPLVSAAAVVESSRAGHPSRGESRRAHMDDVTIRRDVVSSLTC